jgi:molybdopterin-containing oxidoreductase family iron-sulfur binding subunit
MYDAVSAYGITKGNELSFGKAVVPSYDFAKAEVIVSFGCDFLANWISPIEHARQYADTRKLRNGKKSMSRHVQFEAMLSLTGSNADNRYKIKPSQQSAAVAGLYNRVAAMTGGAAVSAAATPVDKMLDSVAKELVAAKGKSLVVSGSNDPNEQVMVNAINSMLGNYGATINMDRVCNLRAGNDAQVVELMSNMNNASVGAIILWNTNPVYTLGKDFATALSKVSLKISLADHSAIIYVLTVITSNHGMTILLIQEFTVCVSQPSVQFLKHVRLKKVY